MSDVKVRNVSKTLGSENRNLMIDDCWSCSIPQLGDEV
jgi:hypothetical protein